MRLDRDGSFTQWLAFGAHPRRLQDDHHGAALLGEALKNSCKNLAGADLVDRFAVSLGIGRRARPDLQLFITVETTRWLIIS